MNILRGSVAALFAALDAVGGTTVTLRFAGEAIEGLAAVPLATKHDDYGTEEAELTARERDWLVWADDLVKDGQRWTPQRGMEIDWIDAHGQQRTFQVLPRADDRCFRHTDQTLQQLRVYTVEKRSSGE